MLDSLDEKDQSFSHELTITSIQRKEASRKHAYYNKVTLHHNDFSIHASLLKGGH